MQNNLTSRTRNVPASTLGRFFMDSLLPDSCKRIVYIDGDTWIRADPTPLIEYNVPEGRLAAVEDPFYFRRNDIYSKWKKYPDNFKGSRNKSQEWIF